jgi:hypothetical protein
MIKKKNGVLLIIGLSLSLATFSQKYLSDSLKNWITRRNTYSRSIDSFRIQAAGYQDSHILLDQQYSTINDTINNLAKKHLIDRAIAGNVLLGQSHDMRMDSLRLVQTRITYAIQFLNNRFDECLTQIDSCMTEEKKWQLKIDVAIKHGAGKLPRK